MFNNINNKNNTESVQIWGKRDGFRVEIRRRCIEEYKKKIRSEWLAGDDAFNSFKQQASTEWNVINKQGQNMIQNGYVLQTKPEILQKLQELSLIQSSQLCKCDNLHFILSLIKNSSKFSQIQDRIAKVILKICINEIYWTQELLTLLIVVLIKIVELGADCSEFLINLSQCADVQLKVLIYGLILGSGILERQFEIIKNKPKNKYNKLKTIRILSNFILVPPVISHSHPYLKQSQESNKNYFVDKICNILRHTSNVPFNETVSKRLINKQIFGILQIFYGLCSRFKSQELRFVLTYLKNDKWQFFQHLMCKLGYQINKQSETPKRQNGDEIDVYGRPMQLKINFKMLQTVQVILKFCLSEQCFKSMGLEFVYNFLPAVLNIIATDCSKKNNMESEKMVKFSKQYYCHQLEDKYELLMLQVLYTLLNVKDQLGDIPALQYISVSYPSLFHSIFNYYGSVEQQFSKWKFLAWILQLLSNQVQNICQHDWANRFVQNVIHNCSENQQNILEPILETVENALINEDEHRASCQIMITLRNGRILGKLEDLATMKVVKNSLLSTIQNIISILEREKLN